MKTKATKERFVWGCGAALGVLGGAVFALDCDSRDGQPSAGSATPTTTSAASTTSPVASVASTAMLLRTFRCGYYAETPVSSFAHTFKQRVECLGEWHETETVQSLPGSWVCVAASVLLDGPAPTEALAKVEIPGVQWLDEQRQVLPAPPNAMAENWDIMFVNNHDYEERLSRIVRQLRNKPDERKTLCDKARTTKGDPEARRATVMDRQRRYLETGDLAVSSSGDIILRLFQELDKACD